MRISYSNSTPDNKTEEIYKIVYSFFEDKEKTEYLLKVLGISIFTNKHEQLNRLTGSGRNGKSLIVNWLSSILGDYATTAEPDMLTTNMRNGVS